MPATFQSPGYIILNPYSKNARQWYFSSPLSFNQRHRVRNWQVEPVLKADPGDFPGYPAAKTPHS